jgi:hypothetical protein
MFSAHIRFQESFAGCFGATFGAREATTRKFDNRLKKRGRRRSHPAQPASRVFAAVDWLKSQHVHALQEFLRGDADRADNDRPGIWRFDPKDPMAQRNRGEGDSI